MYNYLISNGLSKESVGVYNTATPAKFVAGGGNYLTSETDNIINLVRRLATNLNQPLPANINIEIDDKERADIFGGHSFSRVYLNGVPDRIISDLQNSLEKLMADKLGDESGPCFFEPKISLMHKTEALALNFLDPNAKFISSSAMNSL